MKLISELLKEIPASLGKDVELTYRDGTKLTGFIQGAFRDPDGLIVHKHRWPKGEDPMIRISLKDIKEVKIESDLYQ